MSAAMAQKRAASEELEKPSESVRVLKKSKMAPAIEKDASTTIETEAVRDSQDSKPEKDDDLGPTASQNLGELKKTGVDDVQSVDQVQPVDQKQPVETQSLDHVEDEEYDSGTPSDEETLSSDGSDDENVSDPEYGEPYGFGPARDRDQSNAWITDISAEDEATAEIGFAAEDEAFDAYFDEHGMNAVYEEMGIASDSNDSESEAERKRNERSKIENDMDAQDCGGF